MASIETSILAMDALHHKAVSGEKGLRDHGGLSLRVLEMAYGEDGGRDCWSASSSLTESGGGGHL